MARYGITILLGAFLLFQVQPLIAKLILPWFGGGAGVWTACMLFFQVMLLAGYGYAHLLRRRVRPRTQAALHVALLVGSLLFLPITPGEAWKPAGDENPILHILLLLSATVGFPYLLLAATGPLLQSWCARDHQGRSPYRLYSLSNAGALAALLSFPFLFEPNLSVAMQVDSWSAAYVGFAALSSWCAVRVAASHTHTAISPAVRTASTRERLSWLALAALPSAMLLAITNTICQDIAVVPFLWVLPLALYLLTFIVAFDGDHWYRREWFAPLLAGTVLFVFLCSSAGWFERSIMIQIVSSSAVLFSCGMVCHGELARRKPAAAELTSFYLFVALGGAVGGTLVAVVAPLVFDTYAETDIGLVACLMVAAYAVRRCRVVSRVRTRLLRYAFPLALGLGVVTGVGMRIHDGGDYLEQCRNFFGHLTVRTRTTLVAGGNRIEPAQTTSLTHGHIVHGRQITGPTVPPNQGLSYYWPGSGVGYAIQHHPAAATRPLRVGVIGLGTGTLAHYARAGDDYHFYEINPAVCRIADARFSYLSDARSRGATIECTVGDARIQLERELESVGSQEFDVLVVDAFSSDAIPVHLLTRECNRLYSRHLARGGLLVVHITNRHVDLRPVTRGLAADAGKEIRIVLARTQGLGGILAADWVIITDNAAFLARDEMAPAPDDDATPKPSVLWTDAFSSLWHVLK